MKHPKKEEKVYIGGQAVMEGVMMRAPTRLAIAVRRPADGKIETHVEDFVPLSKRHKVLGWPVVRGVAAFIQSLVTGMNTITRSAQMMGEEVEEEEPSRFEKWLSRVTGRSQDDIVIFCAVVLAIVLAVGLFFVVPSLLGSLLNRVLPGHLLLVNLLEGLVRIGIFLGYIGAVTRMKEIKRVFMYHGAEHKTVYCHEHDEELTVENCEKYPVMHPRCGTAFLLIVMIVSILVTSVAGVFGLDNNPLTRILIRIALLPFVAGLSYEALQYLGRHDTPVTRVLRWPGMQLQRLTALQPTSDMLEVAIVSMKLAAQIPLTPEEEHLPPAQLAETVRARLAVFADGPAVLALQGRRDLHFAALSALADGLAGGLRGRDGPVLVAVAADVGKALGQALAVRLPGVPLLCLDGVQLPPGSYLDVAAPIASGQVLPVVIKTLVF